MIRNGFQAADDDDDDDSHSEDDDDSDNSDNSDRGNMVNILEDDEELEVSFAATGQMFSSGEDHSDDGDSDNTDEEYAAANRIALSHENLPSLISSAMDRAQDRANKSRRGTSCERSPKQQFIPKYLETTAYGALHSHLAGKCGKAGGSGTGPNAASGKAGGEQSSNNGAAAHGPASGLVAPDMA
ncbi:hypothetical protein GGI21_005604 [Coemansia aciculifera]|nr:hypothetical protein GGI21_005604 [Coemansia aciculifera]